MSSSQLEHLLNQWRKLREAGLPVSAAELCRDCPELAPDLRRMLDDDDDARTLDLGNFPVETERLGRYVVKDLLGAGGFGCVYLAHDEDLDRLVAVKLPYQERTSAADVEAFLREAQIVARLDHPHIVPVFDVGRDKEGRGFVVSKYLEGKDLAERIKTCRPSVQETARLMALIAEAVHHAHEHKVIHRDIKPSNILMDGHNAPHVVDFGLALKEEELGKNTKIAGTPAYMSPEQARREGHRVDRRSDIFSLGVVLYELLTGAQPFSGSSVAELLESIATSEPVAPRCLDDTLPRELERICLKAMAKRSSERYVTAQELADDLRLFLATTQAEAAAGASDVIVPKGLRSFDADDAGFFLELLPGVRDRNGLPESVRYWKKRIEATDGDATFSVALLYGPSGCGKSSLVKAGLLPRLAGHVVPVFIEATAEETEARLLRGLRKRCPALAEDVGLVEALGCLRRGRLAQPGVKFVLIIDQFEQWLHAAPTARDDELTRALRQCDGEHVQCLLMVRDDFAMAATRFMAALDLPIVQGSNFATIDVFDPLHARKVLASFGRAFGRLTGVLAKEQEQFLDQSIAGLAQGDQVVPVRLALFAEMVKGKPWTLETLKEIGGAEGVGVAFIEEAFSSHLKLRYHERAARAILKALLPEQGSDIKGSMLSKAELLDKSGYAQRQLEFEDLLRILDAELRLITPTDPTAGSEAPCPGGAYYQLTHDYLVPALRSWLTSKQRETLRGRAELTLVERAAQWNARPESRLLPSWLEWLRICCLTRRAGWLPAQRKMMRQSTRYHLLRGGVLLGVLAVVVGIVLFYRGHVRAEKDAAHAADLVGALHNARIDQVPALVEQMSGYRQWTDPLLRAALTAPTADTRQRLHSGLALLPTDPEQVENLFQHLLRCEPAELLIIRDALWPQRDRLLERLWAKVDDPKAPMEQRFRCACALAAYDVDAKRWDRAAPLILELLLDAVQGNPGHYGAVLEALRPIQDQLLVPLESIFRDRARPEADRLLASNFLADFGSDRPKLLLDLLLDAEQAQFMVLFPKVQRHQEQMEPALRQILSASLELLPTDYDKREALEKRQANAALALQRIRETQEVWTLLQHRLNPGIRSQLVHRLGPLGVEPRALVERLGKETDVSARRALILSLGEFEEAQLPTTELLPRLLDWYEHDPDPGIHAAVDWLLRRWRRQSNAARIDAQLAGKPSGQRRWYVNGQGQTMVLFHGPIECVVGSPPNERGREGGSKGAMEQQRACRIERSFALAAKEVTVNDFRRFRKTHEQNRDFSTSDDCPVHLVSWYDAVAYCNWLSEQEGIERAQWCYEPNGQGVYGPGLTVKDKHTELAGYRLPSEAEWEYACRAGASTSRYYGDSDDLLEKYARYAKNSLGRSLVPVGSLKPNDYGLFETLGNVEEWCQDRIRVAESEASADNEEVQLRVIRGGSFVDATLKVRAAVRDWNQAIYRDNNTGFRVARTVPD